MVIKNMNMKMIKIAHWVLTGLLSAMMLMSVFMYVSNYESMVVGFPMMGFPAWLIYPLAIAKLLGVVMLLTKFKSWLTEWAYAGFFFNFLLAIGTHISLGGGSANVVIALVLLIGSYTTWKLSKKLNIIPA